MGRAFSSQVQIHDDSAVTDAGRPIKLLLLFTLTSPTMFLHRDLLPVLSLWAPLVSAIPTIRSTAPSVTVKNGSYTGLHNSYYNQDFFLGIPYAQVSHLSSFLYSISCTLFSSVVLSLSHPPPPYTSLTLTPIASN